MEPTIITRKMDVRNDMRRQSAAAHALVAELIGKPATHSETGRPRVDAPVDISITHKREMICVAVVPTPYRIGIDMEYCAEDIHEKLFIGSVATAEEIGCAQHYCVARGMSANAAIPLLWSIKEAFFKCIDRPIKPRSVSISKIDINGVITFGNDAQIKKTMHDQGLAMYCAGVDGIGEYVRAWVVMEKT